MMRRSIFSSILLILLTFQSHTVWAAHGEVCDEPVADNGMLCENMFRRNDTCEIESGTVNEAVLDEVTFVLRTGSDPALTLPADANLAAFRPVPGDAASRTPFFSPLTEIHTVRLLC